jgi:hypothetical protein
MTKGTSFPTPTLIEEVQFLYVSLSYDDSRLAIFTRDACIITSQVEPKVRLLYDQAPNVGHDVTLNGPYAPPSVNDRNSIVCLEQFFTYSSIRTLLMLLQYELVGSQF